MQVSRCEVCGDARDRDRLVKCPECGRRMCPSHRSATIPDAVTERPVRVCVPCKLDRDIDDAEQAGAITLDDDAMDALGACRADNDEHPVFGRYDAQHEVP